MNFLSLDFLLPIIAVILKQFVKNPVSLSHLKGVLIEIDTYIQAIVAALSAS